MRLELVTPATVEPLTLADAKQHLRVTVSDEDALITRLLITARRQVEIMTRRRLITQHWRIYFDSFPWSWWWSSSRYIGTAWPPLDIACFHGTDLLLYDVAPVSAIDSVKYIDTAGVLQTLASSVYQLVPEAPARLVLAYNQQWPDVRGDREGVRVEVTCGYGAAAAVPQDLKSAMLLIVGHLFENREDIADKQVFTVPGVDLTDYVVPVF